MIGLSCVQIQSANLSLSQKQKFLLKQMCRLSLTLKDPSCGIKPEKGLEGMLTADEILKEEQSVGVLIGGLSEKVWNQRRKQEELYQHKDVDVLVLDKEFDVSDFEGGIDWWLPKEGRLDVVYLGGNAEIPKKWWTNANNTVLAFGINQNYELKPGLYIPDRADVLRIKTAEAEAFLNSGDGVDEDVSYAFRRSLERKIKTKLPKFIREKFKDQILSLDYGEYPLYCAVEIDTYFDQRILSAINSYGN